MNNPTYAQLFQKGFEPPPRQSTEDPVLVAAKAILAEHPHSVYYKVEANSPRPIKSETCHKILTGLILMYAKDYIRNIPSVTIQGCVNPEVKRNFMQLLEDERNGVPSEITEWDIVGHADDNKAQGRSWMDLHHWERLRCDRGSSEFPDHDCLRNGVHCIDDYCFSENDFLAFPLQFLE
ncbi:uncharacterized protein K452DRAFT_302095 [Aplosporella prunicola CBS 121167]|uniref:Uncharacterized protein n=1 Tax=Aplosporella prunicola CBS 121167 TaxID=1176127 RepID=A0A6A6AZX0_9PEZI|nr:uncharacterized protein K452DRAFT_302095 [Aplosporella prunicola CBS 121167]KAF2137340.1 hypothetical protein K452DRAFT_302095 [Aplosporella prunicola CBS 121167]